MTTTFEEIKKKIIPILKEAGVTRSAVFGSYSRGDTTPESDIDLLVELPEGKSLLDLAELQLQLETVLKKKIDVVSYHGLSPYLKQRILAEQKILYEV